MRHLVVVFVAVSAYILADLAYANFWLSVLIACSAGLFASEARRALFEKQKPFTDLLSFATLPLLLLVAVSTFMLVQSS